MTVDGPPRISEAALLLGELASGVEEGYADVNDVRLHYVSRGSGPLVLLLHGFPEFWYMWRRQLAEFGRDYRAVAVDMRGYNLSSRPSKLSDYEVPVLVADVEALADHFGAERFILVGHDWGGAVAWAFAIAHPDRLARLVIINAPHPALFIRQLLENPGQQDASKYMLMLRSPLAETLLSVGGYAGLLRVFSKLRSQGLFEEKERAAYVAAWSRPGGLTGALNYYRATKLPGISAKSDASPLDGLPDYGRVNVPTLVVWGENDEYLRPENLDGLESFVPNLTVNRLPDASHWVVQEKPDELNTAIREFIQ
jgi:pimeloyl-ACP methyl ester carboxylesterase